MKVCSSEITTSLNNFVKEYFQEKTDTSWNFNWNYVMRNMYFSDKFKSMPMPMKNTLSAFYYHLQLHAGMKVLLPTVKIKQESVLFEVVDEQKYVLWLLKYSS